MGLRLFGFLGPAPGCLWWSKALLNFKGTWSLPGGRAVVQRTARAFVRQKPAHRAEVHRRAETHRKRKADPAVPKSQTGQSHSDHDLPKGSESDTLY